MMTKILKPELSPRVAIRLSGTGGQGLILAGRVLAEAAALYDGLNVVQTNSYGPEARGGASRSEVVISKGEVDTLRSIWLDGLICLSQAACDAYYGDLRNDGLLITDSTNVDVVPTSRAIDIPMTQMAIEECGYPLVTNMVSLGALCGVSGVVSMDSLKAAVRARVPAAFREINEKAVDVGYSVGRTALGRKPEKMRLAIPDLSYIREGAPTPATRRRPQGRKGRIRLETL